MPDGKDVDLSKAFYDAVASEFVRGFGKFRDRNEIDQMTDQAMLEVMRKWQSEGKDIQSLNLNLQLGPEIVLGRL